MQSIKRLKVLVPLLAGLLLVASVAFGAPLLGVSPANGPVTTTVTLTGTGFGANEAVDIFLGTTDLVLVATSGTGGFSTTVQIPNWAVPLALNWFTAVGRHSGLAAQNYFYVVTSITQWRGGARHTGLNPYETTLGWWNAASLDLKWRSPPANNTIHTPVTYLNNIYFASNDQKVYCYNKNVGAFVWDSGGTIGGALASTPAIDPVNKRLYIGAGNNKVYCLNLLTGAKLWDTTASIPAMGPITNSSPALAGGIVYVGTTGADHKLYAINAATGAKIWDSAATIGAAINSSPAVANGRVYVGAEDSKLYCFDAALGTPIWNTAAVIGNWVDSSPAVANGRVIVGSWDTVVYAYDADAAAAVQRWNTGATIGGGVVSSPAVADNRVYVGANDGKLYCLDANTGAKIWDSGASMFAAVRGSPMVANGAVYVCSQDGGIYAFDTGGTLRWTAQVPGWFLAYQSPIITDGRLYVPGMDNRLYCFDLTARNDLLTAKSLRPDPLKLVPNYKLPLTH